MINYLKGRLGRAADYLIRGGTARDSARAEKQSIELCKRVQRDWAYLLRLHGGTVSPKALPGDRTSFDYGLCRAHFPDFDLQISEGRGETRVEIAVGDYRYFEDLVVALGQTSSEHPKPTDGLAAYEEFLVRNWAILAERNE